MKKDPFKEKLDQIEKLKEECAGIAEETGKVFYCGGDRRSGYVPKAVHVRLQELLEKEDGNGGNLTDEEQDELDTIRDSWPDTYGVYDDTSSLEAGWQWPPRNPYL